MNHDHSVRLEDRVARQEVRAFVTCPRCGAPAGQHCIKARGGKRFASHTERWAAYRELGMPKAPNA